MDTVTQSANIEKIEGFEQIIIPLCGEDSVLLHVDVARGESGIVDLVKTKASLQVKNKTAIEFYCCFDWCCSIGLSLNKQGYVCNRKDNGEARGDYDFKGTKGTKETPTTATLRSLIERLEFLDNDALEYRFRDLQETLSWKFQELKEKEKLALFDELFPGLKYKIEKTAEVVRETQKAVDVKLQIKSQPVFNSKTIEGTVYLIGNRENNTLKIGFTNNDARTRLAAFQASCAHRLEIIKTKKGSLQDEKELLKRFKEFNIRREWFNWDDFIIENF